jgi:cobalt-zinc-cadmium efflux system membrane fusion protein
VLEGLEPGAEYVVANSYLVKADLLKSSAAHDH